MPDSNPEELPVFQVLNHVDSWRLLLRYRNLYANTVGTVGTRAVEKFFISIPDGESFDGDVALHVVLQEHTSDVA